MKNCMNPNEKNPRGGMQWVIEGVLACSERPGFPKIVHAFREGRQNVINATPGDLPPS